MLKELWRNRARLSWTTLKDYLRCRRDFKMNGVSDIPLITMTEKDIRDPEHIFRDQESLDLLF